MHSNDWSMKRHNQPRRRILKQTYKNYTRYKRWLREDFEYRCGYCNIHENVYGGYWHFHVDHYKPKSKPEFQHLETVYSNLLYSCDQCNTLKSDIWISDDPIKDGVGWLDPCEHDLNEHYYYGYRDEEFSLICLTKVGQWMSSTLALNQPARIRRYKYLAEEEIIEMGMIEFMKKLIEEAKIEGDIDKIEKYLSLLNGLEKKVRKRYLPEPFEVLHRDK